MLNLGYKQKIFKENIEIVIYKAKSNKRNIISNLLDSFNLKTKKY